MDIRRIADSDGHTPYDVALAAKSRNTSPVLLHMLNPATDLLRVFTVQELAVPGAGWAHGVGRLARCMPCCPVLL